MDVTCRNKKLSTDKNRIVKAVVFVACMLFTVIYGIISVPLKSGQININQTIPEKGKN